MRTHHRHHRALAGGILALGAFIGEQLVGVAVIGRPKARELAKREDGTPRAEVTRLCVEDERPNVCSLLYGRARRVVQSLGMDERMLTYTLADEPGTSLVAAGLIREARIKGRSWSCPSRPRTDKHPTTDKVRWGSSAA